MTSLSSLGPLTAFAGGVVSFLSPCVLSVVPGYLSYVAGQSVGQSAERRSTLATVVLSVLFVAGFSVVFVLLGLSATAIGQLFLAYRTQLNWAGGTLIAVLGLYMTGWVNMPWLMREHRFHPALTGGHPGTAFLLGLLFGFGWTPCIGPILGAILTMSTVAADSAKGATLLAGYAAGLGVPFLLSAQFTNHLGQRLRPLRRLGNALHRLAALTLMVMGLAIATNQMPRLGAWMLQSFPGLAAIG